MVQKALGAALGVAGALLWFMPLGHVSPFGFELYQTGQHIGGIAYLLLLSCALSAVFAWTASPIPHLMAAVVSCLICGLLVLSYADGTAWGLVGLCIVAAASLVTAIHALRSSPAKVSQ